MSTKPFAMRLVKPFTSYFAITVLAAAVGLMPLQSSYAQSATDDTFSLTLKDADIRSLIETVSAQTGKNFIVDPRVQAKVTLITSEPVSKDKLFEMFLSVLQVHGFATVPAGDFTKIVPTATGVQGAVPVAGKAAPVMGETMPSVEEQAGAVDELITQVIQLVNVPAEQLIPSLQPLLPQSATISAQANSNTIIITDRAANLKRITKIIHLLDD